MLIWYIFISYSSINIFFLSSKKTIDEFVKVMNGFNATMQGARTSSSNTFTFDPSLKLPDIVGM
jgi:hypothetical protein